MGDHFNRDNLILDDKRKERLLSFLGVSSVDEVTQSAKLGNTGVFQGEIVQQIMERINVVDGTREQNLNKKIEYLAYSIMLGREIFGDEYNNEANVTKAFVRLLMQVVDPEFDIELEGNLYNLITLVGPAAGVITEDAHRDGVLFADQLDYNASVQKVFSYILSLGSIQKFEEQFKSGFNKKVFPFIKKVFYE